MRRGPDPQPSGAPTELSVRSLALRARQTILDLPPRLTDDPFSLGVASGDPTDGRCVIWTRPAPSPFEPLGGMKGARTVVGWEVAHDEGFGRVVRRGDYTATPAVSSFATRLPTDFCGATLAAPQNGVWDSCPTRGTLEIFDESVIRR